MAHVDGAGADVIHKAKQSGRHIVIEIHIQLGD
jgi:hypothetical protein